MSEPSSRDVANQKLVLVVTTLGSFMTPFDSSATTLAIPLIGADFGGGLILLSWISIAYLVALTTFLLVFGRIGDIRGRRILLLTGVLVFTFASVISGLSISLYQLIFARLVQGIGTSMMSGNSMAFLTSVLPSSERGKAIGIVTGATYAGLSLGPVIGGFLISQFGWRSIFYINVPIGLVAAYLCYFKTYETQCFDKKSSFDALGAASLTTSIFSILASITLSQAGFLSSEYLSSLVTLGVLSFLLFCYTEKELSAQPLIDMRLFAENRMFALSNVTAFLNYLSSFGIGFLLSLYLQAVLRLDPNQAGLIMLSQPILMTAVSPLSGRLSDRIQPKVLVSIGLAIMSICMLVLSSVTADTSPYALVLILATLGLGYGLFSSPNTSAVMGSVSKGSLGVGSSTLSTMRFLGQSLSMVLVAFILTSSVSYNIVLIGRGQLNVSVQDFLLGFSISLRICAIIAATAVVSSLWRGSVLTKN